MEKEYHIENNVVALLIQDFNLFGYQQEVIKPLLEFTENKELLNTIVSLQKKNIEINSANIQSALRRSEQHVVLEHLASILNSPNIYKEDFAYYLSELKAISRRQQFIKKLNYLSSQASKEEQDIQVLGNMAIESIILLFQGEQVRNRKKTSSELLESIKEKCSTLHREKTIGVQSSLDIINKTMGGFQNSDFVVIAGRPGMGKTAFMVQQIVDAVYQDYSVGVFSLEMSSEQVMTRIIANITDIPISAFLRKGLNNEEFFRLTKMEERLNTLPIYMQDAGNLSLDELLVESRIMKLKHDIKILFIDYLQLISNPKAQSREQEISQISRALKGLAKELDIPVVVLSQLSRSVEQRENKFPILSDLRDSGAIEQDADQVIFIYRPEYYGIKRWDDEYNCQSTENEAEIIVAKNRNGQTHSERCSTNLFVSQFFNLK